jgi:hypothetical protein
VDIREIRGKKKKTLILLLLIRKIRGKKKKLPVTNL